MMEQVPWCHEGFFIDRADRDIPLGKDLLHILGYSYLQEASSMVPVTLLDPKPGEAILDMASAPGSKATQIAALMQGQGVLVCNDMQDKRIWTLRGALNRLGVKNAIVTKKMGQWFSKHMTERFDRVLIDAPCTAQGTIRKDPNALKYTSMHSINKAAALQRALLESAVHATRVGGRIVYSTCTLTPEENEEVVLSILEAYAGQIEVITPDMSIFDGPIHDSLVVQGGKTSLPMVRIWPQTFNTEGFFAAVLRKTAPTRDREHFDPVSHHEERVPKRRVEDMRSYLEQHYGTPFLEDDDVVLKSHEHLLLTTKEAETFFLPVSRLTIGLPLGRVLTKAPLHVDHDFVTLKGGEATKHVMHLDDAQWETLIAGQDCPCPSSLQGHVILTYRGLPVGRGRARDGKLKNHLPRWIVTLYS